MIRSVYVSSAVRLMTDEELLELLEMSRRNNERLEVTGLLLYQDGNFMQLIEGPDRAVVELQQRIELDPRHRQIITILREPTEERLFSDWAMSFRNLSRLVPEDWPGLSSYLSEPLNSPDYVAKPERALKLLAMFRRNLRV